MSKHTPGPWIDLGQGDIVTKSLPNCDADGCTDIAAVYITTNESGNANARLIAAAPELLEALCTMLAKDNPFGSSEIGGGDLPYTTENLMPEAWAERADEARSKALAAIAKAVQ